MVNVPTSYELADFPKFSELTAERFATQIKQALDEYQAVISRVKTTRDFTWDGAIQPLEEAAERLDKIWGWLDHINSVAKTSDIREVYEQLLPHISNFHTEVLHDKKLFMLFIEYKDSIEFNKLATAQQTIINNTIRDFNLSGVDLNPDARNKYKGYVEGINELENRFSNNVLDATEAYTFHINLDERDKLAGLPKHTVQHAETVAAKHKVKGWVLTLDYPCYHAIMAYAEDRNLRETFYREYNTRATNGQFDNTSVIAELLKLRYNLARVTGYECYAEYSLIPKSAESVSEVNQFMHDLATQVRSLARTEFNDLTVFAHSIGLKGNMQAHDFTFYAEKLRKEKFHYTEEEYRDYFPEPRVLTGMFKLARQLFGLSITEVADFDKWHKSVRLFKVVDAYNKLRGYFYIDLYARPGKIGGAWVAECSSRVRFANDYLQRPVAFLNCNFAPPVGDKPGLLSHGEVITLFHEFGHTLHHVLTKVDFFSVSGMNGVAWDAVELPSQFMENWCWEWVVMQDISENVNTGEPLPRKMFDQLVASKNFLTALAILRQIEFSLFDMMIHEGENIDAHETLLKLRNELAVVPVPDFNRYENSFTHIFDGSYAAGYYSYLWAEVLSCDAFDKFRENGLINPELGKSFLVNILEQGGAKPAMELFVAFAGRKPTVDALLKHHGIE